MFCLHVSISFQFIKLINTFLHLLCLIQLLHDTRMYYDFSVLLPICMYHKIFEATPTSNSNKQDTIRQFYVHTQNKEVNTSKFNIINETTFKTLS